MQSLKMVLIRGKAFPFFLQRIILFNSAEKLLDVQA